MKTVPNQQTLKSRLRTEIRRKRASLGAEQRKILDAAINRHLIEYAMQLKPEVITAFMAFDGEPDLTPALSQLEKAGVTLALPVIRENPGRAVIRFHQWAADSEMKANRYGIAEPAGTAEILLPEIDLALIPLVAWDEAGGRLGMGESFYDRLFKPFAQQTRPVRMGVGYQVQKSAAIALEPWDIPLHFMLSESGWFTCGD